jgi:hypothetical protein
MKLRSALLLPALAPLASSWASADLPATIRITCTHFRTCVWRAVCSSAVRAIRANEDLAIYSPGACTRRLIRFTPTSPARKTTR